jgi:hypothetical protein
LGDEEREPLSRTLSPSPGRVTAVFDRPPSTKIAGDADAGLGLLSLSPPQWGEG